MCQRSAYHARRFAAVILGGVAIATLGCTPSSTPRVLPFLVDSEWLASHSSSHPVVIHVGVTDENFVAGHIPGARFVHLGAVASPRDGLPNMFPTRTALAAVFGRLGVGNDAPIVIYGDDAGLQAARVWAALDILGHGHRAALLDGGLAGWRAEERPLESGTSRPEPARFTPASSSRRVVVASWIRERLNDDRVVLIDARPPAQFTGSDPGRSINPDRSGHLPGAHNLYWMDALEDGPIQVMKSAADLRSARWELPTGPTTVVTYCRTGMQASYTYFEARMLGFEDVRLYDGSFIDWSTRDPSRYPVEKGF